MKNILILAAENSAENYGVQVVNQFGKSRTDIRFFGVGGEKLAECGVEILIHNRDFAVIGIIEVLSSIFKFKRYQNRLVKKALEKKATAALLIDFPDFNLRLAKRLKKAGITVYYYIGPTVWAWRYSRIKFIRKYVDHLFVIFPFETAIYQKENISFTYTGHPLLPMIRVNRTRDRFRKDHHLADGEMLVSLLPGSRTSEVTFMLPEMIRAIRLLKKKARIRPFLLKAYSIDAGLIDDLIDRSGEQICLIDQTEGHDLINSSDLVITTCGTSNLEIALLGVPFVVCYRLHSLSFMLGIHFVKIRLYSIVNILAQEEVVPELIQKDFKAEKIVNESMNILTNRKVREKMRASFKKIRELLQQDQKPSEIIVNKMINDLSPHSQSYERRQQI